MITVYSTPICPWCKKTKEFLRQHNMDYSDVDVTKDRQAAMDMIKKSGQMGVPVTDIDGKIIVGFDVEALKEALNIV